MNRTGDLVAAGLGAALFFGASVLHAAPVVVFGPSPVAPFGGIVVNFEGFAEGTLIDNEYAALGVTFTQDDGGTPMIDNLPALFGYGPGSGIGMLTGSQTGGAPFPTVAGLVAVFAAPVGQVGAFFSDTGPLGSYTFTAFNTSGGVLESITLTAAEANTDYAGCGSFPAIPGCGLFVGFDRSGTNDIGRIQFGPSAASGDAFSIDDLRFLSTVPEPTTLALMAIGIIALGVGSRRRRRS